MRVLSPVSIGYLACIHINDYYTRGLVRTYSDDNDV